MITSNQIRAARALLNWSQTELSNRSGLTTPTIANIELSKQKPSAPTLQRIFDAFDVAGLEFTPGEGVKKKTGSMQIYSGRAGFQKFYQDIDSTALTVNKDEFLVCNVDERDFLFWLDEETLFRHYSTMNKTSVKYRILIVEGDDYMPAMNFTAEYKWTPAEQFYSVPFYVYGDKVAYIGFDEGDVTVFVVESPIMSTLCRRQFDEMWQRALVPNINANKGFSSPVKAEKKTISAPKKKKVK